MIKANNYACFETPVGSTKKLLFFDNLPILLGPLEKISGSNLPPPRKLPCFGPPTPLPSEFPLPSVSETTQSQFC